jgi:general L-amino acid transport system substrate-binding protein
MRSIIGFGVAGAVALGAVAAPAFGQQAKTLDTIKARGSVSCGVSTGNPGFSNPDDKGKWTGFDVDFCRAVAAAIFNDPDKVSYKPLTAKERFTALQSGEVDILSRTTTWTMQRDSALGLVFAGVMYYDGQGFMVNKKLGVKSAKELGGASVCVSTGTTTERNLADYFRTNNLQYKPVVYEKADEIIAAYQAGRCDVYTTDQSSLYTQRTRMQNPADHVILPEIISKEPLGPQVRQGDFQWFTIVKWTYFALLNAEELGITQKNVEQMAKDSKVPAVMRVLGTDGDYGPGIGLTKDWAVRIIKAVGNYGEMYERTLGEGGPIKIARGYNRLWSKGGLQYAPPIQ